MPVDENFLLTWLLTRLEVLDEALSKYRGRGAIAEDATKVLSDARREIEHGRPERAVVLADFVQIIIYTFVEVDNEPNVTAGDSFRQNQRAKARKPRIRLDDGVTLSTIIEALAGRRDYFGDYLPAQELWGEFFSELEALGLGPAERDGEIMYDSRDRRRTMKFSSFAVAISKSRPKPKKKLA
jgi:hypothetical protein